MEKSPRSSARSRRHRAILARQNARCWLCNEPIDWTLPGHDPMSGSIDHVIPIARGGADVMDNIRAAHLIENIKRQDKPYAAGVIRRSGVLAR